MLLILESIFLALNIGPGGGVIYTTVTYGDHGVKHQQGDHCRLSWFQRGRWLVVVARNYRVHGSYGPTQPSGENQDDGGCLASACVGCATKQHSGPPTDSETSSFSQHSILLSEGQHRSHNRLWLLFLGVDDSSRGVHGKDEKFRNSFPLVLAHRAVTTGSFRSRSLKRGRNDEQGKKSREDDSSRGDQGNDVNFESPGER